MDFKKALLQLGLLILGIFLAIAIYNAITTEVETVDGEKILTKRVFGDGKDAKATA